MNKERYDPPELESLMLWPLSLLDNLSFTEVQEGGFTGVVDGGELPEDFDW